MNRTKNQRKQKRHFCLIGILALILILGVSTAGTLAYLIAKDSITNIFVPQQVQITIEENFSNNQKSNITVKNTGDVEAYVRVMLISSTTDTGGNLIADKNENLTLFESEMADDWKKIGDYYYYSKPIKKDESSTDLLNGESIVLAENQTITVLAQGIQAKPRSAMEEAWGVGIAAQIIPTESSAASNEGN